MARIQICSWLLGLTQKAYFRYSEKKVLALGPDLACAYWLVRVGASFRLVNSSQEIDSYWSLRKLRKSLPSNQIQLEEIDFSDSVCMDKAFDYLNGLNHVQSVKMNFCVYIRDDAVLKLTHLEKSLKHLEIQVL